MASESLGVFEGHRLEDGSLAFYPTLPVPPDDVSIQVSGYVLPVTSPASDWYFAQRHSRQHSGLDVNLNRSPWGDVELGQPIYATCNGLVVFAGRAQGTYWGNLVVTASVDADGLLFWRYAHCRDVYVDAGQVVPAGTLLASIGKGAGDRYYAHLHLDCWRGSLLVPEMWLSGRVRWLDPLQVWADAGHVWKWGER